MTDQDAEDTRLFLAYCDKRVAEIVEEIAALKWSYHQEDEKNESVRKV